MIFFHETYMEEFSQRLAVERVVYRERNELQELVIFDNPVCGRVLAIDGAIQTTERDEHVYHEMLVHPAMLAHGAAKQVLIVGGGDGGALRRVLEHPVERVTLVEIDRKVIDLTREYLPSICGAAFGDERADVIVADGARFLAETERRFDIILVDAPDPQGPAQGLFTESFYRSCRRCLSAGGIVVTQNGVPFSQLDELTASMAHLGALFRDVTAYLAAVPTFGGGALALGWASDAPEYRQLSLQQLQERYELVAGKTRHYNPALHLGAFALPTELGQLVEQSLRCSR